MVNNDLPKVSIVCDHLNQLADCAKQIINFADDIMVWLFEGQMGAGKTTLIKELCKVYGVIDNVNSPTFSIVNEYADDKDNTFYHFDFYRINDENEALDIGIDDYFYSGYHCFVEWPSKIENLFPEKYLKVDITVGDQDLRLIELTRYE